MWYSWTGSGEAFLPSASFRYISSVSQLERQRRSDCKRVSVYMEKAREAAEADGRRGKRGSLSRSDSTAESTRRAATARAFADDHAHHGRILEYMGELRTYPKSAASWAFAFVSSRINNIHAPTHAASGIGSDVRDEPTYRRWYINRKPCTELPLSLRSCQNRP